MFLSSERTYHFFYEIVYIKDLHLHTSVIDLNRQTICDIVAECGDSRVIVRTAPFSVKVRETIYEHFRTGFFPVFQKKIFACFLAAAILTIAETTCQ